MKKKRDEKGGIEIMPNKSCIVNLEKNNDAGEIKTQRILSG